MNYLICGVSYNLIDREIDKIAKDMPRTSFSLLEVQFDAVLDDLSYDGMFAKSRVVILKNIEVLLDTKNSDDLEKLISYLKNGNSLVTLILISSSKISEKIKKNKEFLELLKVINTPIITRPFELADYFAKVIKEDGYGISTSALNQFAIKCASNLDIAFMEWKKLKNIKGKDKLISETDIREYISNYNTTDIFELKDAIINKDISAAVKMIDDLETAKMEVVPIVVMLAKEYMTLYNIAYLASNKLSNEAIGLKLDNMHPYRVKLLRSAGAKYTLEEIKKDIQYLCKLDLKMVSEDNLGWDEIRKFLLML